MQRSGGYCSRQPKSVTGPAPMHCLTCHSGSMCPHPSVRGWFRCSANSFRQEIPVARQKTENESSGGRLCQTPVQPGEFDIPRTVNRGDRIRTCDLVLPKHPRYQAAPRPVTSTLVHDRARGPAVTESPTRQGLDVPRGRESLRDRRNCKPSSMKDSPPSGPHPTSAPVRKPHPAERRDIHPRGLTCPSRQGPAWRHRLVPQRLWINTSRLRTAVRRQGIQAPRGLYRSIDRELFQGAMAHR